MSNNMLHICRLMAITIPTDLIIHGIMMKKLKSAFATIRYSLHYLGKDSISVLPVFINRSHVTWLMLHGCSHQTQKTAKWWTVDSTTNNGFDTNARKIICFNLTEGSCVIDNEFNVRLRVTDKKSFLSREN